MRLLWNIKLLRKWKKFPRYFYKNILFFSFIFLQSCIKQSSVLCYVRIFLTSIERYSKYRYQKNFFFVIYNVEWQKRMWLTLRTSHWVWVGVYIHSHISLYLYQQKILLFISILKSAKCFLIFLHSFIFVIYLSETAMHVWDFFSIIFNFSDY